MSAFTEVSVITDGEAAEVVAEVLRPFAYRDGVVLEQQGDLLSLDPAALEPQVTVKIYLPAAEDTPELRRRIEEILYHLNRLYPVPAPAFRVLQETDWANAWKEHYRPFRIGDRIWIRPSWYTEEQMAAEAATADARAGDITLVLDPGMAFGTGTHPTTQKCVLALEQVVRPGMRVLDVGTGSGILAIAAAKLGATAVSAVDTDLLAVQAADQNAQINGVSAVVQAWQGDLASVAERPWDVVVVNILAPVIIDLLENGELLEYVAGDGALILSGIIDEQAPLVEAALLAAGGQTEKRLTQRDWVSFIARRAS